MPDAVETVAERAGRVEEDLDVALFEQLYDEYGEDLRAYACRFLGDSSQAEDVIQEVFLRAWRNPGKLLSSHARQWLYVVARNHMVDLCRAGRTTPRPEPVADTDAGWHDDVWDRLSDRWALAEALAGLSAEHRDVITHVYFRGMSTAEAARALDIPEGTVKSRTFYAMRALRSALAARGVTK
jgi:RNA polymerase sigma-70 factor (ECF subfamily)